MFGLIEPSGIENCVRYSTTLPPLTPHQCEATSGPQLIQLFVPGTNPHGCDPARYAACHTGLALLVKCQAPVEEMPPSHATGSADQSVFGSAVPTVPMPP